MSEKGYPMDPSTLPAAAKYRPPNGSNWGTMSTTTSAYGSELSDDDGSPPLLQLYNAQYRKYIDLVDQLRAFGLDRELPLPRVAVIGVQSCGKSSVLEGISGVCLPRGIGTVTRCPVELQMKYNPDPASEWEGRLFCQNASGQPHNRILKNPASVADEVGEAQRFLAGPNGLSSLPITLELRAHNVPDLTLIDLPGLIEVPMPNQPADLPDKINKLVTDYISTEETIIMVVVACNSEIATTKALKIAREQDTEGRRTLGVLTKPDLVDKGTEGEILSMVANPERYRIRKGFTVVRLRGQAEVDSNVPLEEAATVEDRFFLSHPQYKFLPKDAVGTRSLATKLTHELVARIKEVLPSLKEETHCKLIETEKALSRLGNNVPKDTKERLHFLTDTLNKFVNKVWQISEGNYGPGVPPEQRLLYLTRPFIEEYAFTVEEMCPSGDDRQLMERIAKEIREQRGRELPGFLPFRACQAIIYSLLQEFVLPAKTCLHKINACVETFLAKVAEENFGHFPNLEKAIKLEVDRLRHSSFTTCDASIDESFEMEYLIVIPDLLFHKSAYGPQAAQNAYHFDVVTHGAAKDAQTEGQAAGAPPPQQKSRGFGRRQKPATLPPPPEVLPGENEASEATGFTMDKIAIYFKSALDRLMGIIPMKIHWYLIKRLAEKIQSDIIAMATQEETLDLLLEDEKTAAVRSELEEKLESLRAAHVELTKI